MKKWGTLVLVLSLLQGTAALAADPLFKYTETVDDVEVGIVVTNSEPEEEAPMVGGWQYPIAKEILLDPDDLLVLANKDNLLDKDYPPDDDVHKMVDTTVKKASSSEYLVRVAVNDALKKMFEDASADGVTLVMKSAYRSHYRQSVMYENRLKDKGYDDGWVQKGGASDHQTGLGVDITDPEWAKKSGLNEAFYDTDAGRWLEAHCKEYGFVIRYPKDKKDITGINYEPWHLRYVGIEVAHYMMENGLSLEEFTVEAQNALAADGTPGSEASGGITFGGEG